MLSDPNVKKIMPKAGNRYQSALALARRARDIENRRVIEGDPDIKDGVDIASEEIVDEKVYVKINGKYVIDPKLNEIDNNKNGDKE